MSFDGDGKSEIGTGDVPRGGEAVESQASMPYPTPPAGRWRPSRLLLIVAVVVVLLAAGTAVALAVPVVSVSPDKSLAELLPATTAFYISADLNPSGATRANLNTIERAFTSQPGWANVAKQFNSATSQTQQSGQCYQQTQGQALGHLSDLGHTSAVAFTDTHGLNVTSSSAGTAIERRAVFLASLDIHMSLFDALRGFNLSLQQTTTTYQGVTIYQENFPSCGKLGSGTPSKIYAALYKGYVVLGLLPDPIKQVIDTGAGRIAALSSLPGYQSLVSRLPADQLAGFYVNSKTLGSVGGTGSLTGNSSLSMSKYGKSLVPVAGALAVESDGFRLVSAAAMPSGTANTAPAAGRIAQQLPADTLALLSIQSLGSTIHRAERELKNDHVLSGSNASQANRLLTDITGDLAGEVDLALLHPAGKMSLAGASGKPDVPAALFWQVKDEASALGHLQDLAVLAKIDKQLQVQKSADGTSFWTTKDGYGYAVRKGWAIVSLQIGRTLDSLSKGQSLASVTAYQKGFSGASTPSSLWYVNLASLRTQLESSFLSSSSSSTQSQYQQTAKPILAPLLSLSGSTGTSADGKVGVSTVFLGIGSR